MFCPDKSICCTIGDSYTNTNYSTVICANKILTAVITLLIIWGACMIKVRTTVANVKKHLRTPSQHIVRADNLVDHMRSKHDQSSYDCDECGETFEDTQ